MLVKVLDGCALNGNVWVFAASATDVGYRLTLTDTVNGEQREYANEPGRPSRAITDVTAVPGACDGPAVAEGAGDPTEQESAPFAEETANPHDVGGADGCNPTATDLCLQNGRFRVTGSWSTADGRGDSIRAVSQAGTTETGLFYFFGPNNWEVLVKVLDGCALNGHYWVFAASATDLGLHITVTDTVSGASKSYTKSPGQPAPALTDVGAFSHSCES